MTSSGEAVSTTLRMSSCLNDAPYAGDAGDRYPSSSNSQQRPVLGNQRLIWTALGGTVIISSCKKSAGLQIKFENCSISREKLTML